MFAAPPAAPAGLPDEEPQLPDEEDFELIRQWCRQPLESIHAEWVTPLYSIMDALLDEAVVHNEHRQYLATFALFVLWGLIRRHQFYLHKKTSPAGRHLPDTPTTVNLLRSFVAQPQGSVVAQRILQHARLLRAIYPPEPPPGRGHEDSQSWAHRQARQVDHMVAVGKLSKATRTLEALNAFLLQAQNPEQGEWLPPVAPDVRAHVGVNFPQRDEFESFVPLPQHAVPSIQVEASVVAKILQTRKADRSEGVSGLSNAVLKALSKRGTAQQIGRFNAKVCSLFNFLLSGEAAASVHPLWVAARLALIDKTPGSEEKRMLGIGEVLYRALAAAVVASTREQVAATLKELGQLAFAIPGGVEMAAVLVDIGADDEDYAAISLDVERAFYSVKRSEVLDGLHALMPGLVRFFYWSYGRPIELRDYRAVVVGEATTGVFIGDGMSAIYFPVALHRTLQRLTAVLRQVEVQQGVPEENRGFVVAVADDVTIKARTDVVMAAAPLIAEIFEPAGLRLNRRKSFIIGPRVLHIPEEERPQGWELFIGGKKTLGRPLGPLESQRQAVDAAIAAVDLPTEALRYIRRQYAFRVIQKCLARRLDYLAKVIPTALVQYDLFLNFDTSILECLKTVMGFEHSSEHVLRLMAALPPAMGGLGITPVAGVDGLRHRRLTFERVYEFLLTPERNHLVPRFFERYAPGNAGAEAGFREAVDQLTVEVQAQSQLQKVRVAAKRVVRTCYSESRDGLVVALTDRPETQSAAAFLIGTETAVGGFWVDTFADSFVAGGLRVEDGKFAEAIRARVMAPFAAPVGGPRLCDCNDLGQAPVDLRRDPYHPAQCRKNGGVRTDCHDQVVRCLYTLIKQSGAGAGTRVHEEPRDYRGPHRPDLVVERMNHVTHVDVVIASPMSRDALDNGSAYHPGVAAHRAEARKRRDYRDQVEANVVIPFAIELTGRFGPAATEYVHRLAPHVTPHQLRSFYRSVSQTLANSLGSACSFCRQRSDRLVVAVAPPVG